jgi:hypothetical protein
MVDNHDNGSLFEDPDSSVSSSNWEDQEVDEDESNTLIISLFDDKVFSCVQDMLSYTQSNYGFDLIDYVKRNGTVFYPEIMLKAHWLTFHTRAPSLREDKVG